MARATRTFETDLADLSYQIGRSEGFDRIRQDLEARDIDDQEAQERIADLLDNGHCKLYGDRGPEEWSWKLSEYETGQLIGALYRHLLGE